MKGMIKMGFWDEFWKDMDKPCFAFYYESHDDNDEELKELKKQNKMLKMLIQRLMQEGLVEEKKVRRMINVSPNQIEFDD